MDDVRYALDILALSQPAQETERQVTDYLTRRYADPVASDAILAVGASVNWLVGNWDELGRAGLRVPSSTGSTFLEPILVVLEKLVFSDPSPHWWTEVARFGAGHQIREARQLLEAEQDPS